MKSPHSRIRSVLCSGLVLSVAAGAVGCGHDDNHALFSSGVDTSKRGATLSDSDKQQFCTSLDQHVEVVIGFQELAQLACLPFALVSSTRAECQQKLNDCAAQAPNPVTVDARQTHDQTCYDSLAMCDQSVGALEGCVNVNVSAVRAVLNTITCARYNDMTAVQQASQVMDTARTCANSSSSCSQATTLLL